MNIIIQGNDTVYLVRKITNEITLIITLINYIDLLHANSNPLLSIHERRIICKSKNEFKIGSYLDYNVINCNSSAIFACPLSANFSLRNVIYGCNILTVNNTLYYK